MYLIERTDEEIDDVLNATSEQQEKGGSQWPGQTFEDGVDTAIRWITGSCDDNPMEG